LSDAPSELVGSNCRKSNPPAPQGHSRVTTRPTPPPIGGSGLSRRRTVECRAQVRHLRDPNKRGPSGDWSDLSRSGISIGHWLRPGPASIHGVKIDYATLFPKTGWAAITNIDYATLLTKVDWDALAKAVGSHRGALPANLRRTSLRPIPLPSRSHARRDSPVSRPPSCDGRGTPLRLESAGEAGHLGKEVRVDTPGL